jgi:HEAT repeat protein
LITDPLDAEGAEEQLPDFETALRVLTHPDEPLQPNLVAALSDPRVADVQLFRSVWSDLDDARRIWLARRLFETAEASFQVRFERLFGVLLSDPEPEVRALAVEGLWEDDDPRLVPRFVDMLQHDVDPDVRARAAAALGEFIYQGALEEIDPAVFEQALDAAIRAAEDEGEDILVRRRATESAGYADRAAVRAVIEMHMGSPEADLRIGAVCAAGRSADEAWSPMVLATLADREAALRYEAAIAAGKLGIEEAIPALIELIDGDDREIQLAAIWALGEIGGRRARRALDALAGDPPDDDFAEAVEDALGMAALADGQMPWGFFDLDALAGGEDGLANEDGFEVDEPDD